MTSRGRRAKVKIYSRPPGDRERGRQIAMGARVVPGLPACGSPGGPPGGDSGGARGMPNAVGGLPEAHFSARRLLVLLRLLVATQFTTSVRRRRKMCAHGDWTDRPTDRPTDRLPLCAVNTFCCCLLWGRAARGRQTGDTVSWSRRQGDPEFCRHSSNPYVNGPEARFPSRESAKRRRNTRPQSLQEP